MGSFIAENRAVEISVSPGKRLYLLKGQLRKTRQQKQSLSMEHLRLFLTKGEMRNLRKFLRNAGEEKLLQETLGLGPQSKLLARA